MAAALTIDIYSDVMCPWCVIGYKQLEKALGDLAGEIEAEVRWRPFELNPDMPEEGEETAAHILRKYGRAPDEASTARMIEIARDAGYDMRYLGEGEPPSSRLRNTFRAHKLLAWALAVHGAAMQTKLKLALFDANFQQRRDVSDPAVLLEIAEAIGLERDAAAAALSDEELGRKVRAEEREAMALDITGVPAMLVAGRYMIPGAQDAASYARLLRKVAEKELGAGS